MVERELEPAFSLRRHYPDQVLRVLSQPAYTGTPKVPPKVRE
jgi:hypothetical protein